MVKEKPARADKSAVCAINRHLKRVGLLYGKDCEEVGPIRCEGVHSGFGKA